MEVGTFRVLNQQQQPLSSGVKAVAIVGCDLGEWKEGAGVGLRGSGYTWSVCKLYVNKHA